jgi:hypothetical protein
MPLWLETAFNAREKMNGDDAMTAQQKKRTFTTPRAKSLGLARGVLVALLATGLSSCGGGFDDPYPVQKDYLDYYSNTYTQARKGFRTWGTKLSQGYKGVSTGFLKVASELDDDLTVDYIYIPAQQKKRKLIIISSGVHGVEGFVGSAVQELFMDRHLDGKALQKTGILLIHGINPYGYKYHRRVSENNVDLNRNSDTSRKLFQNKNHGYRKVQHLLNPQEKVDIGWLEDPVFTVIAVYNIAVEGMAALRQAVLQGQYEFPKGLYYGGKDFEPQIQKLHPFIRKHVRPYRVVLALDIHTGYGKRGKLHLFPNPAKNKKVKRLTEKVFAGRQIDWGDNEDFYTVTGDFTQFVGKICRGKDYIPMTFEYGTLDSQTTTGSIDSMHNMILENQGHHYGYADQESKEETMRRFMEMYFPSSEAWRSHILKETDKFLPKVLKRFQKI